MNGCSNVIDTRKYSVAEFFCGCGGLSHGFFRTGRFRIVLGNDIKKPALHTFELNHSNALDGSPATLLGDIRQISMQSILEELQARQVAEGELDCLIGGPPCQGFSQMRRSEERKGNAIVRFKGYDRLSHDPRNDLVLRFLEIAAELRPKIIFIENVPQMLRHGHNGVPGGLAENVRQLLSEMGYVTEVKVVNAADYGIPQLRERAFFFASRVGHLQFPLVTHISPESPDLFKAGLPLWRTVKDAIFDLPFNPPSAKDDLGGGSRSLYRDVIPSEYAATMRSQRAFPFNHLTRDYSDTVVELISQMRPGETWESGSARMKERYEELIDTERVPGETRRAALKRLSNEGLINQTFYRKYYWSAYTRLSWDKQALTITANANFLGSGRFTHPERNRGLTMREAARLQSFEDDFRFITSEMNGDTTRIGIGMDMIGEAVPPLLGEAFAREVCVRLDRYHTRKEKSEPQAHIDNARAMDTVVSGR